MPSSLNLQEVEKFDHLSDHWWDPQGPFAPLHLMNPARLKFIRDHLSSLSLSQDSLAPLKSLRLLDVGCGGGLLCEPLTRMGAQVTGLDASTQAIASAQAHRASLDIAYYQGTIETFSGQHLFDGICALEIIEHVDNPFAFLQACLAHLKPGGLLFISTLDRTLEAFLKAIVLAEYVLKWIPRHTHTWQKFLRPAEITNQLRSLGAQVTDVKGLRFYPLKQQWCLSSKPCANYILVAQKLI